MFTYNVNIHVYSSTDTVYFIHYSFEEYTTGNSTHTMLLYVIVHNASIIKLYIQTLFMCYYYYHLKTLFILVHGQSNSFKYHVPMNFNKHLKC